jgi:hypothetical protein
VRVVRWIDLLHLLPRMCLLRRFRLTLQRKIGRETNSDAVSFRIWPKNMGRFRTLDFPVELALHDCSDRTGSVSRRNVEWIARTDNTEKGEAVCHLSSACRARFATVDNGRQSLVFSGVPAQSSRKGCIWLETVRSKDVGRRRCGNGDTSIDRLSERAHLCLGNLRSIAWRTTRS